MVKIRKFALIGLAAIAIASSAAAQEFHVETNKTKQLKLRGTPSSVVIGNPRVADIVVHNQDLLFVTGRSTGSTNLLIFNADGKQIYASDIVVSSDTSSRVSINRGGAINTYNCAPKCESIAVAGDDSIYFNNVVTQNNTLITQSESSN